MQHVRRSQFHDRLRGEQHGRILFPPRFFGLQNPLTDGCVLEEYPCFIDHKQLERGCVLWFSISEEARCNT